MPTPDLTDEEQVANIVYKDALKGSYSAAVGVFLTKWVPLLFCNIIALRQQVATLEHEKGIKELRIMELESNLRYLAGRVLTLGEKKK